MTACNCDPTIREAYLAVHDLKNEIVLLSTIHFDIRSRFSKGENWTKTDEKISQQLSALDDVLTEKATALSIASARHKEIVRERNEATST